VIFVYDLEGQLLGEYDQTGKALREYVWLDDIPVAVFMPDPANASDANAAPLVFYIHADHLNAPRIVVDQNGAKRWRWLAEPFGTTAPETNPDGLGAFTQNLRFPGQYADAESGLWYNYFRNYDSGTGRYRESDPIGLAGGMNTFLYVEGMPTAYTDPTGEIAPLLAMGVGFIIGGGVDLITQLVSNGGNWKCVNWVDVGIAGVSSMSLGGRFGYKATLEGYKAVAKQMTKREAFDFRKQIKRDYRIFDKVDQFLSRRDRPFEMVRDPIASFARTNVKWDVGLTAGPAISLGTTISRGTDCTCEAQ
jgi:RHS repeat-associated protein